MPFGFAASYGDREAKQTIDLYTALGESTALTDARLKETIGFLYTSDNANVHATLDCGARSGEYPRFKFSAVLGAPSRAYIESTSWTYEAWAKASPLRGRARAHATASEPVGGWPGQRPRDRRRYAHAPHSR